MTFYTLVLLVTMNRAGAMTAVPGFSSRSLCESAGIAFTLEAKKEQEPRFYCFPRYYGANATRAFAP